MVLRRSFLFLVLGLLAAGAAHAGNLLCCQDPASGRRVCADTLPDQCRGRAYKVIDSAGNVVREVGPPLTVEQKAQQDEEAKRKRDLEEFQRVQRRKDMALLETYSSVQDIDKARARAEEDVVYGMRQAEKRIADAQARHNRFKQEAEFYKNKELPIDVAKGLKDSEQEISAQKGLLDSKQQDLEAVRAKFAEDKKRYLEITTGSGRIMHPAMGGTAPSRPNPPN